MSVHIAIILDGRRAKKTNKFPVKLRVFFQGRARYYLTVFDLTKEEYGKLGASRVSADLVKARDQIKAIELQPKALHWTLIHLPIRNLREILFPKIGCLDIEGQKIAFKKLPTNSTSALFLRNSLF